MRDFLNMFYLIWRLIWQCSFGKHAGWGSGGISLGHYCFSARRNSIHQFWNGIPLKTQADNDLRERPVRSYWDQGPMGHPLDWE